MTACVIRYRLDGPGPAAFLIDCNGELRVYAQGALGGVMPRSRLLALLAERGCRWVAAAGVIELDLAADDPRSAVAEGAAAIDPAVVAAQLGQPGASVC